MKKVTLMALAILLSGTSVFAANLNNTTATDTVKTKKVKTVKVQYTCTMHPEVVMDKLGKCPKCGMTLVKKTDGKKKTAGK
jgi:ribosomal protein S27E